MGKKAVNNEEGLGKVQEIPVSKTWQDAEKMLRLSNFTIERTRTPIVWVDSNAHLVRVNNAASQCFGYAPEQFCHLMAQDIAPEIPFDIWPQHWATLKLEQSRTFSSQFQKSSGEKFPVEVEENFIRFEGVEYSCSFIKDMTQHILTQKTLHAASCRLDDFGHDGGYRGAHESSF